MSQFVHAMGWLWYEKVDVVLLLYKGTRERLGLVEDPYHLSCIAFHTCYKKKKMLQSLAMRLQRHIFYSVAE